LEKLLNEVYEDGQRNCNCNKSITWTNPYTTPYYSTTCATNGDKDSATITINSTDAAEVSKHIDKIIQNATTRNDVFSKLAKELNF
jgi:hypothetical protein